MTLADVQWKSTEWQTKAATGYQPKDPLLLSIETTVLMEHEENFPCEEQQG